MKEPCSVIDRGDAILSQLYSIITSTLTLQELARPVVEVEVIGADYDCSQQKTTTRDHVSFSKTRGGGVGFSGRGGFCSGRGAVCSSHVWHTFLCNGSVGVVVDFLKLGYDICIIQCS